MDKAFAERFAADWIESWNTHDLDRVLSHYTDDFEMYSPVIIQGAGEPSGRLCGKASVGAYWSKALKVEDKIQPGGKTKEPATNEMKSRDKATPKLMMTGKVTQVDHQGPSIGPLRGQLRPVTAIAQVSGQRSLRSEPIQRRSVQSPFGRFLRLPVIGAGTCIVEQLVIRLLITSQFRR